MAASLARQAVGLPAKLQGSALSQNVVRSKYLGLFTASLSRKFSDDSQDKEDPNSVKINTTSTASSAEGALHKFAKIVDEVHQSHQPESEHVDQGFDNERYESFASMLRHSKFVSLGEHKDRLVQGKIIEVMEDDLYIDFGGKFHCVCPRPRQNGGRYQRGTEVLLSLQCMEMSSAFLGSDVHVTLLEADATLLGLAVASKSPSQSSTVEQQKER